MTLNWLKKFDDKKVVILGYGLEGKSTYRCLKTFCPSCDVEIMDKNASYVSNCFEGEDDKPFIYAEKDYLNLHQGVDFVFKSPGIPLKDIEDHINPLIITSQSNEFIQAYGNQVIGVTGTKGKSTTVTFLYELLRQYDVAVELVGNIGLPAFDNIDGQKSMPFFIYELSSHQLETVKASPKYAVLLNIFEEHLDHYKSYDHYAEAKMNLARWQGPSDYFIYGAQDDEILKRMDGFKGIALPLTYEPVSSGIQLKAHQLDVTLDNQVIELRDDMLGTVKGHHILLNMAVGVLITRLMGYEKMDVVGQAIKDFKGLNHRLAFVSKVKGVDYYNDSISTIPQATIAAIKAIDNTETIIIGGMDRGIDYSILLDFIRSNPSYHWVMLPDSGHRLSDCLGTQKNVYKVSDMKEAVELCSTITSVGKACLLSPAAASYGFYKNFEDRGNQFEANVAKLNQ